MHYNICMAKIKEPEVINMFYSGNPEVLKNQIKDFSDNIKDYNYISRAVIVPHAGLVYSGRLAYNGISLLDKNIKNIFIFAPAHRVFFEGLALTTYDEWKTPFGNIKINQEVNIELEKDFGARFFDEGYKNEHSIEIQIPLIQSVFEDVRIIPVLIGQANPEIITKIISRYYKNKDFGFIISSDLSHFLTDDKAKHIDNITAKMIESGNIKNLSHEQACGATGIAGIVDFANQNNYSLIRVDMYNSSLVSDDKTRVVGYGSWLLYEGSKNKFIKEYHSDYLLKLCRDIILSKYNKKQIITHHAPVFNEPGACFVTLKKNDNLRGCIGSIIAHQPLINDIVKHSLDSAYNDPRFNPVEEKEIKDLTIDISLLSEPKQMFFLNEEDLLNKIVPFKDGIIIKDGNYQAVYLPSVWEEIPDKNLFLKSLKVKAGMKPEHFSKTFEAYKFETEYIEE